MNEPTKSIRLQVLVDKPFREMVARAAHESWMSVGSYMREIVLLMDGADYDTASDHAMIGKELGLEAFEYLRDAAERRGQSVREFCVGLGKRKRDEDEEAQDFLKDSAQLSLFE